MLLEEARKLKRGDVVEIKTYNHPASDRLDVWEKTEVTGTAYNDTLRRIWIYTALQPRKPVDEYDCRWPK